MKSRDRNLGLHREISRRDVLHGFGALAAASFVPGQAFADAVLAAEAKQGVYYPPALSGMRGNHDGSFEVAHRLGREGKRDWGRIEDVDEGVYDLVVVGAGISGLAAAHFYRQAHPGARVLILDNHDDFGGHAKRNEFNVGGRTLIGYGGAQTLEEPSSYPRAAKQLLHDLGVELERFDSAYDGGFYQRHKLGGGVYFDRESWGVNRLVRYDLSNLSNYLPLAASELSAAESAEQMPISDAARAEMRMLLTAGPGQLRNYPAGDHDDYLFTLSYRDFLQKHLGITEPEVFAVLQDLTTDSGMGIEATSAADAFGYMYLPGVATLGRASKERDEPYIHHFPDGNASVARMLVRELMPQVAPGSTMDDVVTAKFDYSKLDLPASQVRLRLNSTVVHAYNQGAPESAREVAVVYVAGGNARRVLARRCVLACYNAMIPAICPELPTEQRAALSYMEKQPMLYTNVALKNWRAWKELGIGAVVCPGNYHANAFLDFPVSMGSYEFADSADDPVVVHMERFFHRSNQDLNIREQKRLGRHELLATSFETIERSVREQLAGILAETDFDAARDIAGITVNRWAHGYADGYSDLEDEWYEDPDDLRYPHVRGRQAFGRIAIANSDAGARAMFESAVSQAYRAVSELD